MAIPIPAKIATENRCQAKHYYHECIYTSGHNQDHYDGGGCWRNEACGACGSQEIVVNKDGTHCAKCKKG